MPVLPRRLAPVLPSPYYRCFLDICTASLGGTQSSLIALSHIVKFSRLMRPVGPGFFSQNPSPGYCSHNPYRSRACLSVTSTTTQSAADLSLGASAFGHRAFQPSMLYTVLSPISQGLSRTQGQVINVLLRRPPGYFFRRRSILD